MLKKIMSCVIVIALFAVMAVAVSAASSYNAYDQYDIANASGANGPWSYMNSSDDGATLKVNANFVDQYKCWYPDTNNWFGVGKSPDANKALNKVVELNSANQHQWGVLVFTAPEDGKYTIPAFDVTNLWNQGPSSFVVAVNTEVKYKTPDGALDAVDGADKGKTATVPEASYDLKKGDQIRFYDVPANAEFVSAYASNLTINFGTAAAAENPKTGDSGVMMLSLLLVLSLGALVFLRKTAKN